MSVHKNPFYTGVHKNPMYWGNCFKRGAWTVSRFKRGLGQKEGGGVLRRGVNTLMQTIDDVAMATRGPF